MTQEMNKMLSGVMSGIRYRLFMFSYQICIRIWLICMRITIWLMEHPIVIHFAGNIGDYIELYNFLLA